MDNKVINKKPEMAAVVKIFKQNLELKSGEMNGRRLNILKRCIERNEEIVNDKDETDIEYINDELDTIKRVFNCFCSMYSIDYTPSTIDNSTFIETSDQIKNKKCTMNPQNKDNNCFQYSVIASLYHEQIKCYPERISKIKPFINNLNWENINFPPHKQDYQKFEMNNKSTALNILQVQDQGKISHLYQYKHNKTRKNKAILLMITDNEKKNII